MKSIIVWSAWLAKLALTAIRASLIVTGLAVVLFVALNAYAYRYRMQAPEPGRAPGLFDLIVGPDSRPDILRRIFGEADDAAALARVKAAPSFELHRR